MALFFVKTNSQSQLRNQQNRSSSAKSPLIMLRRLLALFALLFVLIALLPTTADARPYNEQLIPPEALLNKVYLSPYEETQFKPDFIFGPGIFG